MSQVRIAISKQRDNAINFEKGRLDTSMTQKGLKQLPPNLPV
jgi:hypothetical protein